jgi:hypothetical protein
MVKGAQLLGSLIVCQLTVQIDFLRWLFLLNQITLNDFMSVTSINVVHAV